MLTPRDLVTLLWPKSSIATTSTAPHSQGELSPTHENGDEKEEEEEEERGGDSEEGEMPDEGAPCCPKLYTTGIMPEAKSASSARHFNPTIR